MHKALKGVVQIAMLCALSLISNFIVRYFGLSLPGSIIGIFILFFLLQTKIIRMEWVELGANLLLAELLLFFIPSAVGIIRYQQLLYTDGLSILLVIVAGTIIVMAATGLSAKKIAQTRSKKLDHI